MIRRFQAAIPLFIIAFIAGFAVNQSAFAGQDNQDTWRFTVYLDDKVIGYHHFQLVGKGAGKQLFNEAQFLVTFLKLPVFRYHHKNTEIWDERCLRRIAATTDQNGKSFRVEGLTIDNGFQVTTPDGSLTLPDCISTFAYWDKSFLQRDRLLNSQTGEYLDVNVEYLGEQVIRSQNVDTPANHYRLTADKIDIQLWYSRNDQWLALQSTTEGGRVLRYLIE